VPLHPLEEQFDLPSHLVEHGHLPCGEIEVVREEGVGVVGLDIDVLHTPQEIGVVLLRSHSDASDCLVTSQSCRSVDGMGVHTLPPHVALGSRDEESVLLPHLVQSSVVHVSAVDDVARTGFNGQHIEHVHVMHRSVRDVDERRQIAPQIEERVGFHRCLRVAEVRPWEHGQTKIDRGGIEGVVLSCQSFEHFVIVTVQRLRTDEERLCEGFVDSPVALLVGIAQCGQLDRMSETQVVQLLRVRIETEHDAPCALSKRELPEAQTEELLPAGERFYELVSVVTIDALLEGVTRQNTRELTENVGAFVHAKRGEMCSNRPLTD